jgi:hypothetical protein
MSEIKSQKKKRAIVCENALVRLKEYNDKYLLVDIKNTQMKPDYDFIFSFCSEHCKESSKGWIVPLSDKDDFMKNLGPALEEYHKNPYVSDVESEAESSDTDDESIQKVLSKRLTVESKGEIIEDETLSDSEMEDVISLSRRTRGLYKKLKEIRQMLK